MEKDKQKKIKATMPVISTSNINDITILGDNILVCNGIITAFYVLPLSNYSTTSVEGSLNAVEKIKNIIAGLVSSYNSSLQFTIERTEKIIQAQDIIANLYDTIHIYRPDYEMPIEFTKNIKDDVQSYCLLGIDIQQSSLTEAEDLQLFDVLKALWKGVVDKATGLGNLKTDPEQILKIEESIYRTLRGYCLRATKDLVFYNYISKVFPCYDISYDKLSYINENNFEDIMGSVTQTVSDNFGRFEMHNEGIVLFEQDDITTYGCMLDVISFPSEIDAAMFPMDYQNVVTTVRCLPKDKARTKLKQLRSSDRFDRDEAIKAGAEDEDIEQTQTNIDLATFALSCLKDRDTILCEFNVSILVFADTLDKLKQRIMATVNHCKDRNILVGKSLYQARDFLYTYIGKQPKKFRHFSPIEFPLCFQQNAGATVGDTEADATDWWSPSIGIDVQ